MALRIRPFIFDAYCTLDYSCLGFFGGDAEILCCNCMAAISVARGEGIADGLCAVVVICGSSIC